MKTLLHVVHVLLLLFHKASLECSHVLHHYMVSSSRWCIRIVRWNSFVEVPRVVQRLLAGSSETDLTVD